MKVTLDPQAAAELELQIDYLLQHGAARAARKLAERCDAYFENVLAAHPRTGKEIREKEIWETWIPGTRLIVWYRLAHQEIQIIRVWHAAQDRQHG
jgi:plasmid stabilization system protein ParE